MNTRNRIYFFIGIVLLLSAVAVGWTLWQQHRAANEPAAAETPQFSNYWYSGQAEISTYSLQQARYGSLHPGEAVLIFVTEPFRTDKQVKHESPKEAPQTTVLKLNALRKFVTGVYDYSAMTSVFSPVNTNQFPHALKATLSVQEWCGQVYEQLNHSGLHYMIKGFSYFEDEVQQDYTVEYNWLEDELFTRLRLDPSTLPVGKFFCIPPLLASRLRHRPLKTYQAVGSWHATGRVAPSGDSLRVYQVQYPQLHRTLRIQAEGSFPYRIVGWDEYTFENGRHFLTRAVLRHTRRMPYWQQNQPRFRALRDSLGLSH